MACSAETRPRCTCSPPLSGEPPGLNQLLAASCSRGEGFLLRHFSLQARLCGAAGAGGNPAVRTSSGVQDIKDGVTCRVKGPGSQGGGRSLGTPPPPITSVWGCGRSGCDIGKCLGQRQGGRGWGSQEGRGLAGRPWAGSPPWPHPRSAELCPLQDAAPASNLYTPRRAQPLGSLSPLTAS